MTVLMKATLAAEPTNTDAGAPDAIRFPFVDPPRPGEIIEVAPGVLWTRMPLASKLDHVNVYLVEDGDGYVAIDCGLGDETTKAIWERLLSGPLGHTRITGVLVTHFHPDHVGAAGWLARRVQAPVLMSETEYLLCMLRLQGSHQSTRPTDLAFFETRGLDRRVAERFLERGAEYLRNVTPLPFGYEKLKSGSTIRIGERTFEISTGGGHSDDQVMLYCAKDKLFICADQVIVGITPNIGVWPLEPNALALDEYLDSLQIIQRNVPADALVLPGHKLPFFGLHRRIGELFAHHRQVCDELVDFCRDGPMSAAELVPKLFKRDFNAHHTVLAFCETLAHMHFLMAASRLVRVRGADGVLRVAAS